MVETNLPILFLRDVVLLPYNELRIEFSKDYEKKILDIGTNNKEGGKGIGRFAAFQLGKTITIETVGFSQDNNNYSKVIIPLNFDSFGKNMLISGNPEGRENIAVRHYKKIGACTLPRLEVMQLSGRDHTDITGTQRDLLAVIVGNACTFCNIQNLDSLMKIQRRACVFRKAFD